VNPLKVCGPTFCCANFVQYLAGGLHTDAPPTSPSMNATPIVYDQDALLQRLSSGISKRLQEVVFLVGAPLSEPLAPNAPGVPGVRGMIDLIKGEFEGDKAEIALLERELTNSGREYQAAFTFLQGRRGQRAVNEIVCKAVLAARRPRSLSFPIDFTNQAANENACQTMDHDFTGWHLNPGTESLGRLVASYPDTFGSAILTTNFDPLIEAAIRRAGGQYYKTILSSDANLSQTQAPGCHVVHLHGFWHGVDTLHTPRQLAQPRPHLKDSLRSLLRNKLVVVAAYSGWDDVFTAALMDVVRDLTENPEVLWTFFSEKPQLGEEVEIQLGPGINRGRVNLYAGVDCNQLFPQLYERWSTIQPRSSLRSIVRSNAVLVPDAFGDEVSEQAKRPTIIEGDDEDRPPLVGICVGRETELRSIRLSNARVVFVTGMGGQGKSTVAARYFADSQSAHEFTVYVWRDCKEERERFENQLSSVIERLSHGKVSGEDLARQSASSIIEVLLTLIKDQKVLFTFDNADHYVDLELGKMTGSPDLLVTALLESQSDSRVIFTCRREVQYAHPLTLSTHLEGIGIDAAKQLFAERGAHSTSAEIEEAHELTKGHAIWLDLLAVQVVKQNPPISLHSLLAQIGTDAELLPDKTLRSIWKTLGAPKQAVLRAMAETLKPETEMEISDYLSGQLTHNKVRKTLKTLRSLNLVVIKKRSDGSDLLELHPLIRHFIRTNFPEKERLSYINGIISVYQKFIGRNRSRLKDRPSQIVLQYWTQSAELDIAAGRYQDAFATLAEVADPFLGSAYPREFTRIARILFEIADWVSNQAGFKHFEGVFRFYVCSLCDLGEIAEVDALLEKYEMTVLGKDVRYINYCDLRCYSKWTRGDFATAVMWGRKGQALKDSGVDTSYDVSHNLALAERDSGRPEAAVPTFLQGRQLAEVTDPQELDGKRNGSYYGNIGRCLHLMGQVDGALVCYQKSALLLEKARDQHIVNQGYIRQWIGELLVGRQETKLAYIFLRAAYLKWQQTSPPKALRVKQLEMRLKAQLSGVPDLDDLAVERVCLDWILGKNMDAFLS
jgi:hypothetical protein